MRLVIENGKNISLTETLSIAYEFIGNFGLLEIIKECEENNNISQMYVKEALTNSVIFFAKLKDDNLTIIANREYTDDIGADCYDK